MTLQASGAISFSDVNTELGLSSTSQISMNDTAVRTLFNQASGAISMTAGYGKSNTSTPGAPTSVSASATGSSSASVSFSAPSCTGHLTIDYYQAISSPGCITATGTSPISVTGLSASTSYTFRVRAHNSKGYGCYSSSSGSITTQSVRGCAVYSTAGSYTWVAPAGVTSVSVVVVGSGFGGSDSSSGSCVCQGLCFTYGGNGGAGGGLAYKNNFSVTPGSFYTVYVGTPSGGQTGTGQSYFYNSSTVRGGGGCYLVGGYLWAGDGGGYGGRGREGGYMVGGWGNGGGGGGGAGGYNSGYSTTIGRGGRGAGGYSPSCPTAGCAGSNGGAGGGGGGARGASGGNGNQGASGGGVGVYGQGSSGCGGAGCSAGVPGSGGSYGNSSVGGAYGGGGGGSAGNGSNLNSGHAGGGSGVVRIVWPGNTRTFPSTCVGSP